MLSVHMSCVILQNVAAMYIIHYVHASISDGVSRAPQRRYMQELSRRLYVHVHKELAD